MVSVSLREGAAPLKMTVSVYWCGGSGLGLGAGWEHGHEAAAPARCGLQAAVQIARRPPSLAPAA